MKNLGMRVIIYSHSLVPLCDTNAPVSSTVHLLMTSNIIETDASGEIAPSKLGYDFLKNAIISVYALISSGVAAHIASQQSAQIITTELKRHVRVFVEVFTSPGLRAKNTKPSALYSAAYFATTIFTAALEIAYGPLLEIPELTTRSVSPIPELIVITFFAEPNLRRGRKALVV